MGKLLFVLETLIIGLGIVVFMILFEQKKFHTLQ